MLRFTGVKLDLLVDYEMLMMIESGIRGGICQVSHRKIEANNPYLENYDKEKDSVYAYYVDCNNLYGYAMSQPLPTGEFKWIEPDVFTEAEIEMTDENGDVGYILDVDLEYPQSLHKDHNDLPFLCENLKLDRDVKLVPHLNGRKNYVVHYLALRQAVKFGLKIIKINRILMFKQSPWLKPYIDLNTNLRAQCTSDFEKDLYKLYNNSVYGKTMENVRKRLNMKLVTNEKQIEKEVPKPEFIDRTIYHETLAAVHLRKKSVKFDKPIFLGMSILDLSKIKMYYFHYDVMQPLFGPEKLRLGYMDTDSFIYEIKCDNLYAELEKIKHELDTSDLDENHLLYSPVNKKVVGKFKDEAKGKPIKLYIGIKAKVYMIEKEDEIIKKIKGVQTVVVKKFITRQDFLDCAKDKKTLRTPVRQIRSKEHILRSIEVNKLALTPYDDKRIVMPDGISTRAIGYRE